MDEWLIEEACSSCSYPPMGGTCVYFVRAASGGRSASSNASTPRFRARPLATFAARKLLASLVGRPDAFGAGGSSTLGIRDTDRNAPQYKPRLGRSSRRRAGLPPSAAHTAYSNYATISTLLLRRSGHVLCAKSSERNHTCRPAQRKILQTTPLPKQPQVPKQQRGRLELHLFPARLCASARGAGRAAELPT